MNLVIWNYRFCKIKEIFPVTIKQETDFSFIKGVIAYLMYFW